MYSINTNAVYGNGRQLLISMRAIINYSGFREKENARGRIVITPLSRKLATLLRHRIRSRVSKRKVNMV